MLLNPTSTSALLTLGNNTEQVPLLARTVGKEGKFKVTPVKIAVTILCIVSVVITTVLLLVFLVHKNNLDCPIPVIEYAEPSVACLSDGQTTFQFTGSNFLRNSESETPGKSTIDETEVTLVFNQDKLKADGSAVLEGDCLQIEISHTVLEQCGGFSVTYAPYQYENPGLGVFTVNNPKPCASQPVTYNVTIVPRVKIDTFDMPLCVASGGEPVSVVLKGEFYQINGLNPSVVIEFDTGTATTSTLDSFEAEFSGCSPRVPSVQQCDFVALNFTLPDLPPTGGNVLVNITSRSKPSVHLPCAALGHAIPILPRADVQSVSSIMVCSAGSTLEVVGQGFTTFTHAILAQNSTELIYGTVGYQSATQVNATFHNFIAPGAYQLYLENPGNCRTPNSIPITAGFVSSLIVFGTNVQIAATGQLVSGSSTWAVEVGAASPTQVSVTIPSNIPPGSYTLTLFDSSDCPSHLDFFVILTEVANSLSVTPPVVPETGGVVQLTWQQEVVTPVRFFLYPEDGAGDEVQYILATTAVSASLHLAELAPGNYTLVGMNGGASFSGPLTVASGPQPILGSCSPATMTPTWPTPPTIEAVLTLQGLHLEAAVSVQLLCGIEVTDGLITRSEQQLIEAQFSVDTPSIGALCSVYVATESGLLSNYISVGVASQAPPQLAPWKLEPSLNIARMAPAVAATASHIYVMGGFGLDSVPLGSMEIASFTSTSGSIGPFLNFSALPLPLAHAEAVVLGDHLYVVGGYDGSASSSKCYRALVLNMSSSPQLTAFLAEGSSAGLSGFYYYAVTTILVTGESLPSHPVRIWIPGQFTVVQLTWTAVPLALTYKIYRGLNPASLWLLAETDQTNFQDIGAPTVLYQPPIAGALGPWEAFPDLVVPRKAFGMSAAQFDWGFGLFVTGGDNENGLEASYEYVLLDAAGSALGDGWALGNSTLVSARTGLDTLILEYSSGDRWLYAGPGTDAVAENNAFEAAPLEATGALGPFEKVNTPLVRFEGYALLEFAGSVLIEGGVDAVPSAAGYTAELCKSSNNTCPGIPYFQPWSQLTSVWQVPRMYPGYVKLPPFYTVIGGATSAETPTTAVESAFCCI